MRRDADDGLSRVALRPQRANLGRGEVAGRQMNAVGIAGERDVGAAVDEQPRLRRGAANCVDGLAREDFQLASGEVLLAKLDVVHACSGRLGNAAEKRAALLGVGAGTGTAVGDVVEQHQMS